VWDDAISEVRFMASFDTSENDIHDFIEYVKQIVQ
jgi:threonine aldolase